jgi:apolipoprotein N-acyltransferase
MRKQARTSAQRILRSAVCLSLATVTGLLLAFSCPPGKLPWLAWIALVPALFGLYHSPRRCAFVYGTFSGLLFCAIAFRWTRAFHPYAHLFVTLVSGFFFVGLPLFFIRLLDRKRGALLFAAPSIWVVCEFIKQTWFLRFPFGVLGYTQYAWLPYIQLVELGGVLAVSWLVVFVNAAVFRLAILLAERRPLRLRRKPLAVTAALLLAAFLIPLAYGTIRLHGLAYETEPRLKVGFAQTLFHPRKVWQVHQEEYQEQIRNFASGLAGLEARLILFPELTLDRPLSFDPSIRLKDNAEILNRLSALSREKQTHLLLGSLELKREGGRIKTFNSMYLFSQSGELAGIYRKRERVPFGEVDPSGGLVPGLGEYIRNSTDAVALDRGSTPYLFSVDSLQFGVLICFESGFPHLSRAYTRQGADFLVNASNDFWSLSSAAMVQHAVMSVFRAIETRRPVLRISNGGFSCYVDERGKYASRIPMFQTGAMTSQLCLLRDRPTTLYVRLGDWVILFSLIGLAAVYVRQLACTLRAGLRRPGKII